jgi:hypothetical protein
MDLKGMADKGKEFGKKAVDKVDMTCDKCGKVMKPGGVVKRTVAGSAHQFCSETCAMSWKAGDKGK